MLPKEIDKLIRDFYAEVFNGHDAAAAAKYMRPDYIQHNPGVGQGRDAFIAAFAEKFRKVPTFHLEIKHLIVQDDMACVHLHAQGLPGKAESVVCDLYRIQDGLLAEHWDVLQPIPPELIGNNDLF